MGGGLVVFGTRHDVQRQRAAVAASQGDNLLGMDLEQAGRGDRADGKGSLGALEAQPRARSAGDHDQSHLAGRQHPGADLGGPAVSHALAVGLRLADHVDRLDPGRLDGRCGFALNQLADQTVQLIEIDRGDLGLEPRTLGIVQLVPPGQQVSLS